MTNLAESLFDEDGNSVVFQNIHTVYYDSNFEAKITNNKKDYLANI